MTRRLLFRMVPSVGVGLVTVMAASVLSAAPAAAATARFAPAAIQLSLCIPILGPLLGLCDKPPVARLQVSPSSGQAPLTVTADGSASTDKDLTPIKTYRFNFGDGTVVGPQRGSSATHSYATGGHFTVTLTVTDTGGLSDTATQTVTVTVPAPQPPSAHLAVSPVTGPTPLMVRADGAGSTDPRGQALTYTFNFGDGSAAVGPQTATSSTHSYGVPGTYTVALTVTDTAGLSATSSASVSVSSASLYVDNANTSCSDTGAGTTAAPYCTIGKAVKVALPGASVSVAPGTYPEQVAPKSGSAGAPITYAAQGPGTIVLGDATRNYGFNITGVHDVVVDGFELSGQQISGAKVDLGSANIELRNLLVHNTVSYGIRVDGSSAVTVSGCTVSAAGSHGILVQNSTGVSVLNNVSHDNAFHGIALLGTSGSRVAGNTAYGNITPNNRRANGIDIDASTAGGSSNNVIEDNKTYRNDDSGIQVVNGSNNNVVRRNVSYANNDHGFDTLTATGTAFVSNTSFGNAVDGFSIEGSSANTTMADNISTGNGADPTAAARGHYDLYVDTSSSGFSSDYDLIWSNTQPMPILVNGVSYASLTAFRASGNEAHGVDADPRLVSTTTPDLHLAGGSPAIDAANAAVTGFAAPDADGTAPIDDPATANTGTGSPPYVDLGAFEYRP